MRPYFVSHRSTSTEWPTLHSRSSRAEHTSPPAICMHICHTGADLSRGATKSRDPLPPELRQSCGRARQHGQLQTISPTISSRSRRVSRDDLAATIHHHRA